MFDPAARIQVRKNSRLIIISINKLLRSKDAVELIENTPPSTAIDAASRLAWVSARFRAPFFTLNIQLIAVKLEKTIVVS